MEHSSFTFVDVVRICYFVDFVRICYFVDFVRICYFDIFQFQNK